MTSARRGRLLVADIVEEMRANFGGRPCAERLADRYDVIVDSLRQADDGQIVAVGGEVGCKVGGRGVGVVAADRVENGNAVIGKAFGGDPQRILAFLDQAALDAVGGIGELDAAIADRRAAIAVQQRRLFAHLAGDLEAVADEHTPVARLVGDDIEIGRDVAVAFDEATDSGRETGRRLRRSALRLSAWP